MNINWKEYSRLCYNNVAFNITLSKSNVNQSTAIKVSWLIKYSASTVYRYLKECFNIHYCLCVLYPSDNLTFWCNRVTSAQSIGARANALHPSAQLIRGKTRKRHGIAKVTPTHRHITRQLSREIRAQCGFGVYMCVLR